MHVASKFEEHDRWILASRVPHGNLIPSREGSSNFAYEGVE
jgi:hypothetical protein